MNREDAVNESDEAMSDDEVLEMGAVVCSEGRGPTLMTFGKPIPPGVDPFADMNWLLEEDGLGSSAQKDA